MWLPIVFLLVSGTVILGPYIAWKLHSHRRLLDGWRRWAAKQRFEFVASSGPVLRKTGARVRGTRDRMTFELQLCSEQGSESGKVFARLVAKGPPLVDSLLELFHRSWLMRFNKLMMQDWIELDDSSLTERWLVRGKRADEARGMIAEEFRRCLLDCERVECVSIDGGEVEIRFDGEVADERALDLALELACSAWASKWTHACLAS